MKVQDKTAFDEQNIFGQGMVNTAFAQYFIGNSYLNPLTKPGESIVGLANVTFEPGCRNNWHIHHAKTGGGQILICTAGEGWYQEEGKDAVSLTPGTVIVIPPEVKHWHGAKADSWFSHIAVEVPGEETSNEWLEAVDDESYSILHSKSRAHFLHEGAPVCIDNYNILSNTVLLVEEGLGVAVCLNGALAIHHSPQLRFVPLVPERSIRAC